MSVNNIGMMDGAYFVGRNEILSWINTTLQLGLAKVEEVRSLPLSLPHLGSNGMSLPRSANGGVSAGSAAVVIRVSIRFG
jgi:hypothetical protein